MVTSKPGEPLVLQAVAARTSLRDEAVRTLQAAIIAGELRPGTLYSAPALAAQLGMSATPVREAMLQLVTDGLVETERNKGFRVIELSDADLDDLTELRVLIEVPIVGMIAQRGLGQPEYDHLRSLATAIERAARTRDMIAHNEADLQFHAALLALHGNSALVQTVQSLRTRSRLYGMRALADSGRLYPTSREHAQLLDLIQAGESIRAEALMRRHLGHVRGSWATGTDEHETP